MIQGKTYRATVFQANPDERYLELRQIAANKLLTFHSHDAGKGSRYVTIGRLKIRFADHENTSPHHDQPDYNCVDRELTKNKLREINRLTYPTLCRKTAFAMHVGLTIQKLKKLLDDSCYEQVCENPDYPNTYTQYVKVADALAKISAAGITVRIPIAQERWTEEDYCGF